MAESATAPKGNRPHESARKLAALADSAGVCRGLLIFE